MTNEETANQGKATQFEALLPADHEIREEVAEEPTQELPIYDAIAKDAFEKAYKETQKKRRLIGELIWFAALIVILYLALHFLIGLSFVDGDSMYPTIHDRNIVLYTRIYGDLKANDIIAIRMKDDVFYVKRVIATEGDEVEIADGVVLVNGKIIEDDYSWGNTEKMQGNVSYPLTVGKGQVFVLGDNREYSEDSRTFGLVYPYQICGKLLYYAGSLY